MEDIGWCWFFVVLDHFNDELISWHTCKRGTRYEAMKPVRAAVRKRFGTVGFHRTLEEEVFSLHHFKTLEEANEAIRKFVDNYNRQWLIYRLGYKSPLEYREEYERRVA